MISLFLTFKVNCALTQFSANGYVAAKFDDRAIEKPSVIKRIGLYWDYRVDTIYAGTDSCQRSL